MVFTKERVIYSLLSSINESILSVNVACNLWSECQVMTTVIVSVRGVPAHGDEQLLKAWTLSTLLHGVTFTDELFRKCPMFISQGISAKACPYLGGRSAKLQALTCPSVDSGFLGPHLLNFPLYLYAMFNGAFLAAQKQVISFLFPHLHFWILIDCRRGFSVFLCVLFLTWKEHLKMPGLW